MSMKQGIGLLIYMLLVCAFVAFVGYKVGFKDGAQRERILHLEYLKFKATVPQESPSPAEKDNGFWI